MSTNDLARDAQSEPGILALLGLRIRSVGIEPVKNDFEPVLRDTGSLVLNVNLHMGRRRPRPHRDGAGLWREGNGVVHKVGEHLSDAALIAADNVGPFERGLLDDKPNLALIVAEDIAKDGNNAPQHCRYVDRAHLLTREFGIEPGGVGDIRYEPVQPIKLVLNLFDEVAALLFILGEAQRFGDAACGR